MTADELFDAMKYGSQLKGQNRSESDLGRFGLGLKSASLSQCRKLTVISKKNGTKSAMIWDLDVVEKEKDWAIVVCSPEETEKLRNSSWLDDKTSGTIVVWENFDILEKDIGQASLFHELLTLEDAEGLISQLSCFNDIIAEAHIGGRALLLRAHIGQVLGGHVAVLAVRAGHFVPGGRGFLDYDNLGAFLVLSEDLILRACAGTQTKRISACADLVDFHIISSSLVLLRDQIDLRSHGSRNRDAKDAAVRELSPFVPLIDRMYKRQFPFAVQRFGDRTRCRADRTQTVIGKVCTVSGIYTNQRIFLLSGIIKAPLV